ncbi:MAG: phosphoethanolamine transferase [Burkholderiales bacterium PBB1]|nr:MAG: phosphoethanolamine transferase [Burkholderiales bacterium PBB1]
MRSSTGTPQGIRKTWTLSTEALVLCVCAYFVAVGNHSFWASALADRSPGDAGTWRFGIGVFVLLVLLHFIVLSVIATRHTTKPLLMLLLVCTAFASYFMGKYSVFLDPTMLRNLLHTDVGEARDLLAWDMLTHLAWQAALPMWLVWRVRLRERSWRSATAWRLGSMVLAVGMGIGAFMAVSQDLSSLMRSNKSMRYLITPGNYVYSLARVVTADAVEATKPMVPVGTDAVAGPAWAGRSKPLLFILVVGETARAMNWGLNGYARQTTPELAALNVVNFSDVGSCGTNTETSVPCMFSRIGRRDYDEDRIRGEESLLHVVKRAGFGVQWRDNQSGCKGVCEGLPMQKMVDTPDPSLCSGSECMDEILLKGLDAELAGDTGKGNRLIVLHQMGSHGPAYHRRAPEKFKRYTPTCDTAELRKCSTEAVVNAYDNSIAYTDHVLAEAIRFLQGQSDRYDTALLYVSDHGESLGENNLFLHGLPYAIAPIQQTQVPMVMWLSPSFADSRHVDLSCLRTRATQRATHDNLFHTMLGLLDVQTSVYEPALDLVKGCRPPAH